jgi:glutathione synthase/RimK-type ligase-like ATP-grasp enzyme
MNQIKVTISHSSEDSPTSLSMISIPNSILKKLKVPTELPLRFRFSNRLHTVVCKANHSSTQELLLDKELAERLCIPNHIRLHLSYHRESRELRLSPIFAVLINQLSASNPPFSKLTPFCKELLHFANQRHTLAYVVTLKEILKEKESVTGWYYANNKWKKEEFPLPQVIYNRIGSRKIENTSTFTELKQKMVKKNIFLFNQTFLNKWDVHTALQGSKQLSVHLPHTHLFEGPLTLKTMVEKYNVVFIKPIHGSLGRGIYRIQKIPQGFQSQYTTLNGQIHKHFTKLSQLYSYLSKRVNPKKHIIQEGIPILHYTGRPIDFRALMQKNYQGEWAVTSMVGRMGPENRFVSNIARGGELSKVIGILSSCSIPQPKKVKQQLIQVARKVCEEVERANEGHFGELGVDLAITRTGNIYLLEVNSKPSKTDDTVANSSSKGRPSVHRLLDYTLFLTSLPTN